MNNDPLLRPYHLKHLTLRNRIMTTAHEPAYSEDGLPGDRYRLYHVERAKGGVALTMTAGSALVSRDSPAAFGNLHAFRDDIVPCLKKLTDDCHEHGAAVMIQLTHLGRRTRYSTGDWLPVLSASPVREPAHRTFPKEAEDWDLDRIVDDYVTAALRMVEAGMDGIEFEAYGHFLDSFWSPATNHRDDQYSGSLDNRLRFTMRVIEAVRVAVGSHFIVGVRMVADENWKSGLSRQEGVEIARRLASCGKIDFLNIIRGHIDTDAALTDVIPIHGMPSAPHLDFAGTVRTEIGFPVFHAARIADIATARHAIAQGKLDMVGMTRAHLADPHIVRKLQAGQEDRIRPCVGATYCLDRIYEGGEALCIHNAATGRELELPHVFMPTSGLRRRIIVAGAGIAGLEAARVAAERGHHVTIMEATGAAGGQIVLAALNPRRRELIGIVEWRLGELERLGVDIHYNCWAERESILNAEPDIVIVATGGLPQPPALKEGADLVVSSWDVISGDTKPSGRVLIYDDHGGHQAMTAAEMLARGGKCKIELVSPERFFAPDMGGMNHAPYMRCFNDRVVQITINTRLSAVRRDGNGLIAELSSDFSSDWREERRIDHIVVEHGTLPLDDLYFDLKPESCNLGAVNYQSLTGTGKIFPQHRSGGRFNLLRIGDAVHARNIHAAVYDGLRYGSRL